MKTNSLLLAGLVSLAGVAATEAQTVYSVNMVGFVNLTIPNGFSMISNPLQGASTAISSLIPAPPEGTAVYKFSPAAGAYDIAEFLDGRWEGVALTLAPGEGIFIQNPNPAYTLTFSGEVVQNSVVSLPAGFSVVSSVVPQQAGLSSQLNFPIQEGDSVYFFNTTLRAYDIYEFLDGRWEPSEPSPAVGASFFVRKSAPANWVRNFSSSES